MSYNYQTQKKELFTELGSETLMTIRDTVKQLLEDAGAFTMSRAMKDCSGDSFTMIAAVEYLVEKGEIVELKREKGCWSQFRVFAGTQVSNR